MAGFPEAYAVGVRPRCVRCRERPDPGSCMGQALEGKKPRRAPAPRPLPGQGRGRTANGLPEGAKLRSGRAGGLPASPARCEWAVTRSALTSVLTRPTSRSRDKRRHGSCVSGSPHGGLAGKELARRGKWSSTFTPRRAGGRRMRTAREQQPRESGDGSSGWESSGGQDSQGTRAA